MKIKLYQVIIEGKDGGESHAAYWDLKPNGAGKCYEYGMIEVELPDLPGADVVAEFLAPIKKARIEALRAQLEAMENAE